MDITLREDNSVVLGKVFHDFPVRIGRDAVNDVVLDQAFVSKFHATLDVREGGVFLRDLGSRNGTTVESLPGNIAPHQPVDLRAHGLSFLIGPLHFRLQTKSDVPRAADDRDRGGAVLSAHPDQPLPFAGVEAVPVHPAAKALAGELLPFHGAYRAAWARFLSELGGRLLPLPAEARQQLLRQVAVDYPQALAEPEFEQMLTAAGLSLEHVRPSHALREEDVALRVLAELAAWYGTPHALRGEQAIRGFARKMQDALDALFTGYVPLRDGLTRLERELNVGSANGSGAAKDALELAETAKDVSSKLLDWTDSRDSAHAIRGLFADLMIQNLGLLTGVMKGAGALLDQLSPQAIKEGVAARARRGSWSFFGPSRFRALWESFEQRHSDLAGEQGETFRLLFGSEFAKAYHQFFAANPREPRSPRRVTAPPPRESPAMRPEPRPAERRPGGPTGTVLVAPVAPRGVNGNAQVAAPSKSELPGGRRSGP